MSTPAVNLALLAKVNHFLAASGERQLKRCPPDSERHAELGDLYLLDMAGGAILEDHVDLDAFARTVGISG